MKGQVMDIEKEILFMLEHIEHELIEIRRFSHPVSMLEVCSSWLKRVWAVLGAAHAGLTRTTFGK